MTTKHFDATPTPNEPIKLDNISTEKVKEAWESYEAKPEYKEFNKHDMIEAMQKMKKIKSWRIKKAPNRCCALCSWKFERLII